MGIATISTSPSCLVAALEHAYGHFERNNDRQGCAQAASAIVETYYFEQGDYGGLIPWTESLEQLLEEGIAFSSPEAELRCYAMLMTALMFVRPGRPFLALCAEHVYGLTDRPSISMSG
ncbi:MAG: hypothetical protein IPK20_16300 [Betaproteobacteria bacterium]|nr:hypothetical protein [Betaproteobacteria bacterium]